MIKSIQTDKYLRVFLVSFLVFALLTYPGVVGWNDASRMAQVQSLVERGTFIIDQSRFADTGDKYFFNQHFYSDKPPLLAIYATPIYFVLTKVGLTFDAHLRPTYYLLNLLTIGALSALGLTLYRKTLGEYVQCSDEWADLVTLVTGTGTLILPYTLVFNNHVPSGVFIFISFFLLLNFTRTLYLWCAVASGLSLSFAGSIDINCFLFIPFLLILFFRRSLTAGLSFGLACIPFTALYLFLNLHTSGSFLPPAVNAALWDYPGSAFSQQNLSGLAQHQGVGEVLFYAFHLIFGSRGLLFHSPILWFSIVGLVLIYGGRCRVPFKTEYLFLLFATALFILLYIFRSNNYSGYAFGIRWFATLMLILCVPLGCIEPRFQSSRLFRRSFYGIACVSVLFSIVGAYEPFTPLNGDELQEKVSPTNTVIASMRLVGGAVLRIAANQSNLLEKVRIVQLILGGIVIFFLLYRLIKAVESRHKVP